MTTDFFPHGSPQEKHIDKTFETSCLQNLWSLPMSKITVLLKQATAGYELHLAQGIPQHLQGIDKEKMKRIVLTDQQLTGDKAPSRGARGLQPTPHPAGQHSRLPWDHLRAYLDNYATYASLLSPPA